MARCFCKFVRQSRAVIVRQPLDGGSNGGRMGDRGAEHTNSMLTHTQVKTAIDPAISPKIS
ncbi:hypothetical protein M413DRAFT_445264, partial [Hebeloma cylindrosporum]